MMQILIGSIDSFTRLCVKGVEANREKAEHWLERNAIIITALNPLIGYDAASTLAKDAVTQGITVLELARYKAEQGTLCHRDTQEPLTADDVDRALKNLRRLTEGGLIE
jgi:fumarate hydratase class II